MTPHLKAHMKCGGHQPLPQIIRVAELNEIFQARTPTFRCETPPPPPFGWLYIECKELAVFDSQHPNCLG